MLTIVDHGERNVLNIDPGSAQTMCGEVLFDGDDNVVTIGENCRSEAGFRLQLGSSSSVRLGGRSNLGHLFVYALSHGSVVVGPDSGFNGVVRLLLHEPGSIQIGHGALFAGEIDVSISDMHSIVDSSTGRRLNPAANVVIGDRVWIAQRSMILKGSHIGDGAIVGAMSLVSGPLPAESVCVGAPAKVVRSGATWRFDLIAAEPADRTPGPPSVAPSGRTSGLLRTAKASARALRRAISRIRPQRAHDD